jgi:hypothetical protein
VAEDIFEQACDGIYIGYDEALDKVVVHLRHENGRYFVLLDRERVQRLHDDLDRSAAKLKEPPDASRDRSKN